MDPTKQLEGFFLEFTSCELIELKEELERQGYSPDSDGMKEALLDFLLEEDEPPGSSPRRAGAERLKEQPSS